MQTKRYRTIPQNHEPCLFFIYGMQSQLSLQLLIIPSVICKYIQPKVYMLICSPGPTVKPCSHRDCSNVDMVRFVYLVEEFRNYFFN